MGLFDTVYYHARLPNGRTLRHGEFQTKHLGKNLWYYTLTDDGRLLRHSPRSRFKDQTGSLDSPSFQYMPMSLTDVELPIHGDVLLHGTDSEGEFVRCLARFTHGRLEWMRALEQLSNEEQSFLIDLHDG